MVSKFYPRGFADESDQIVRHPLAIGATCRRIGIVDATVRKDFYSLRVEGSRPDAFEVALGELEAEAAPAFERTRHRVGPMSNEDRYRNLNLDRPSVPTL